MSENQQSNEIGWSDSSLKFSERTFFKGIKDQKNRIRIVTDKPKMARIHYHDGYFLCLSKYETVEGAQTRTKTEKCCELVGQEPALRFGVVVAVYDTMKDGTIKNVYKTKPEAMDFELQIWIFGEKTFQNLKAKHQEWDLTKHDLIVACTNEQYQHLDIDVTKSTWAIDSPALGDRIKREYDLYRYKDPSGYLGKALSEGEIVARLGSVLDTKANTPEVAEVNGQDFDSMLNELKEDSTPKTGDAAKSVSKPLTD